MRFFPHTPDTDLNRRVPKIVWYCQALADVISRKAVAEERDDARSMLAWLAGELESAVA